MVIVVVGLVVFADFSEDTVHVGDDNCVLTNSFADTFDSGLNDLYVDSRVGFVDIRLPTVGVLVNSFTDDIDEVRIVVRLVETALLPPFAEISDVGSVVFVCFSSFSDIAGVARDNSVVSGSLVVDAVDSTVDKFTTTVFIFLVFVVVAVIVVIDPPEGLVTIQLLTFVVLEFFEDIVVDRLSMLDTNRNCWVDIVVGVFNR